MRALPLTGTPAGNEAAAVAHSRFSPIAEEVAICVLPDARPYRVLHGNNNDDDEIFSVLFYSRREKSRSAGTAGSSLPRHESVKNTPAGGVFFASSCVIRIINKKS